MSRMVVRILISKRGNPINCVEITNRIKIINDAKIRRRHAVPNSRFVFIGNRMRERSKTASNPSPANAKSNEKMAKAKFNVPKAEAPSDLARITPTLAVINNLPILSSESHVKLDQKVWIDFDLG
jgi:hypothetical protein